MKRIEYHRQFVLRMYPLFNIYVRSEQVTVLLDVNSGESIVCYEILLIGEREYHPQYANHVVKCPVTHGIPVEIVKYDLIDILLCDGFDEHAGKVRSFEVSGIVGPADRDCILSAQFFFQDP